MGRGKIAVLLLLVIAQTTMAATLQALLRNNQGAKVSHMDEPVLPVTLRCNWLKPNMFTTDLAGGQSWLNKGRDNRCTQNVAGVWKCGPKGIKVSWDEASQLYKEINPTGTGFIFGCRA